MGNRQGSQDSTQAGDDRPDDLVEGLRQLAFTLAGLVSGGDIGLGQGRDLVGRLVGSLDVPRLQGLGFLGVKASRLLELGIIALLQLDSVLLELAGALGRESSPRRIGKLLAQKGKSLHDLAFHPIGMASFVILVSRKDVEFPGGGGITPHDHSRGISLGKLGKLFHEPVPKINNVRLQGLLYFGIIGNRTGDNRHVEKEQDK